MDESIYLNDKYFLNNPTWDVEDSPWKAGYVHSVIDRLGLHPQSIAEVGCGAGEILNQLHGVLPSVVEFSGFEISPKAFELCQMRQKERLNFYLGRIPDSAYFELLLVLDVFEHVEDYLGFLKNINGKAKIKIFHIPLDMSVRSVTKVSPILFARDSVGHLHYFNKETALRTLIDCGYEIVEWFYTSGPINRPPRMNRLKKFSRLTDPMKRYVFKRHSDVWVRFLGGSMLVVAK